jgi:transcriptional regulator with XRE-family HTH domain
MNKKAMTESGVAGEEGRVGLVRRLREWRAREGVSRGRAAEVMEKELGVPVDPFMLYLWESEKRHMGKVYGALVEKFLARAPKVKGRRDRVKQTKLSGKDLAEMRRLRSGGETLKGIGSRFGVSESYIWRILKGERLAK